MNNHSYIEEEQINDMETKMSFLDSFLSEDNNLQNQDCKNKKSYPIKTLTIQTNNNTSFSVSNSEYNNENSNCFDKYIETECSLNIKTKISKNRKTLKEFFKAKNYKHKFNKH